MLSTPLLRIVRASVACFLLATIIVSLLAIPAIADDAQSQSIPIFEQYGLVSSDAEEAILDNFAIQLSNDPNLTGYVVVRRGRYSAKVAAKKLRYIKNYLVKRRGIPANRVSAFEGKRNRDYTIELYLVPQGKPGPEKTPH